MKDNLLHHYCIDGVVFSADPANPGLYCVATPIGNLADVTLRALKTLASVDVILCEDTRVTRRLLTHYGIRARLEVYNDHSPASLREKLIAHLGEGASIALVSDAGTPLISDPGYRLITAVRKAGHNVFSIPGASAAVAALSTAGLPTDTFFFTGFLPVKKAARKTQLDELKHVPATLILYESPRRLLSTITDCHDVLGNRQAAVARELTKAFEETVTGTLLELYEDFAARDQIKGEIVILVAPPDEADEENVPDLDTVLKDALSRRTLKDAVAEVTKTTGLARKTVYRRALELRDENSQ